ncbi:MAG: DNA repair protein RecN [Coriobacteriaceae bacterium]|jgi:DNA repair protein RecN (Recombination protein N)|nr:DNA repair protein RecN [Coriobacteriaceae bacterium]
MIDEIHVSNLALIRDASLAPSKGLTVLTGETGAGKTALLSACKLLCGERADATAVREGTDELVAEGRIYNGNEELVVSRRVGADGRSRVAINGSLASVGELASQVGALVDLCGQHEHQQLLKPGTHVALLDGWAGQEVGAALEQYRQALAASDAAAAELHRIQDLAQSSTARLDEARFVLQRIDAVNPREGEYEELTASLAKVEHAESLAHATELAHESLAGEGGAIDAVQKAASALEALSGIDAALGGLAESLREAGYVLEDVSREARAYRDSVDFDAELLERDQERVAALQGLMRNFGPRMVDVLDKRAQAADLVSLSDDSAEREAAAQKAYEQAEEGLRQAAVTLDSARAQAAPRFVDAVNAQLAELEMGGASLECRIEQLARGQWTKNGPSQVEFLFQPAQGMQPRPLARIASGGEISRVMLAIKAVLGDADAVETLIFDEVDAGVGGSTALALARVLARLAKSHQVIVVTHLAQIAVAGEVHYQVVKQDAESDAIPETVLVKLDEEARVNEIARMLSGEASAASIEHAKEMLAKGASLCP